MDFPAGHVWHRRPLIWTTQQKEIAEVAAFGAVGVTTQLAEDLTTPHSEECEGEAPAVTWQDAYLLVAS